MMTFCCPKQVFSPHQMLSLQADTVNPFDSDISLRPGNLYANLVLSESEQLVTAAAAIDKLSAAAAAGQDTMEDFSDPVKDISDTAVRKTVEENQDLRRQVGGGGAGGAEGGGGEVRSGVGVRAGRGTGKD